MSKLVPDNIEASRFTREDMQTRDAVGAVICDSVGRILIQDHVKLDFFTIPIGKVKKGEDAEKVIKQELQEELGIEIVDYMKIGECEGEYDYEGIKVRIKTHIFQILSYHGTIENKEPIKHRSIQFMDREEIRGLSRISDATKHVLAIL